MDATVSSASSLPCRWQDEAPAPHNAIAENRPYAAAKRCMDIVVSATALLLLLPHLCVVALAIKLTSPGPILFRQLRQGRGGEPFHILKFRTMQGTAGAQRVTRFGALLRRTSIDELPQLLNVLIGDMSLIGPRPHVENQFAAGRPYRELVPFYDMRLSVRPGITGWAQINGLRGPTDDPDDARARIEHDIAYIQNASIGLDLRILFRTMVREFLTGSGD